MTVWEPCRWLKAVKSAMIPSNMNILIAEDDTFLQKVYTAELTKAGYAVTCVENGELALQKLIEKPAPDLLLLDALMPKKDGFQVLEEKKLDPTIAGIPVVMLTSLEQEKDMQRAAALGVSNYFVKTNIDLEELISIVRGILPVKDTTSGLQQYRGAFITDTRECMKKASVSIASLEKKPEDSALLFDVMRLFHSVKSSSALMGYAELAARCQGLEQRFKEIIDSKGSASEDDRTLALDTAKRIEETIAELA